MVCIFITFSLFFLFVSVFKRSLFIALNICEGAHVERLKQILRMSMISEGRRRL